LIRPIRPEDEKYYEAFMDKLNPDDIRQRLFEPMRHVSHSFAARLTQIDYARAMAFIALGTEASDMLGVSRISVDPDYKRAEFAVITRSDLKGRGIGWALMKRLIDYAQAENIQELWGQVLIDNAAMLEMCRKLGFIITPDAVDPMLAQASLNLEPI
jgi:acetyltransferase